MSFETDQRPPRAGLILLIAFAALGLLFSAVSTHDFVQHLDRQVHAISCSFIPGVGKADASMTSGCRTIMLSPYSSILRDRYWGGIPVALPAASIFAYLAVLGLALLVMKDKGGRATTRYLLAATTLPLVTSIGFFYISTQLVGAVCKLCVGVYLASLGVFASALVAHLRAPRGDDRLERWTWGRYGLWLFEGVAFVLVPLFMFLGARPSYDQKVRACGQLAVPEDRYNVRVKLHEAPGATPAVEVIDPLCPACQSFATRLAGSGLLDRLDLTGVLFPLDNTCNWMVSEALHPGACTVSEAVLCAGDRAKDVVAWSLDHGEELRALAKKDPKALTAQIAKQFPLVAACVGTPDVRARLNKSLRWVAANALPVLTPQLFVKNQRLCEEDTDLGLEYSLGELLAEAPRGGNPGRNP